MVPLICFIIYLVGIPVTFLLTEGYLDFIPDEDETVAEKQDRYFAIVSSITMAFCWPLFWAIVIAVYVISHLLPRFLS